MMLERKRAPRKQCYQCGWDAEGVPLADDPHQTRAAVATARKLSPKHEYDCENCGYHWTE